MLRLLITLLFLAVLIVFALSNTDPQPVWIVSFGWHLSTGTLVLGVAIVSLLIGLFMGWIGELRQRSRARQAENQIRSLEKQVVELHQRIDQLQTSRYGADIGSTAAASDPMPRG